MEGVTWSVGIVNIHPVFAYCFAFEVVVGSIVLSHIEVVEGFHVFDGFFQGGHS